MPSYYELLGVTEDATHDAIRAAYIDGVRGTTAAEGTPGPDDRRLDEAFAVVGEPERRARYDELRHTQGARGNPELLALLAVIADTGGIPTADEVLGAPADVEPPEADSGAGTAATADGVPDQGVPDEETAGEAVPAADAEDDTEDVAEPAAASLVLTPLGTTPTAPVPGTDANRRTLGRRRSVVAAIVAGIIAGSLLVRLVLGGGAQPPALAVGDCVALQDGQGTVVSCTAPEASARVSAITADAAACGEAPLGTLDLGPSGVACLAPV